jgi:methionine-rich copper-binding protein CopC
MRIVRMMRGRWVAAGVTAMALAAVAAAPAVRGVGEARAETAFHLRLVRSTPAENAKLPPGPCHIELWFTEAPELAVTSLLLTGPDGHAVSLTRLTAQHPHGQNPSVSANTRERLTTGSYRLIWRTMAHDGHVMRGTIAFTVGR